MCFKSVSNPKILNERKLNTAKQRSDICKASPIHYSISKSYLQLEGEDRLRFLEKE